MRGEKPGFVSPGTYVGNYADEQGNILHGKHPWSTLPSVLREAQHLTQLLTLEFLVLRVFLRRFPGEDHMQLTPVEMLNRVLGEEAMS